MSKTRVPTKLAVLRGANKVNPERWKRQGRDKEPKPLGPLNKQPPDYLTELQKECYVHLVENAHPDVLCQADSAIVEMASCLLARFRENNGDVGMTVYARLMSALERLGMTPSSRSKVQAMKNEEDSDKDLAEFAA